jgi:hypothetical protein
MVTKSPKRAASKRKDAPPKISAEQIQLGAMLSHEPMRQRFKFWIVGDTPLICHAWSEKARLAMLQQQTGAIVEQKPRDPQEDFVNSLYAMGDGTYGFPVTAIKKAIKSAAHTDRGIAKTDVLAALHLDATLVSVRPALAGASCNLPLVRIFGSAPRMREDMVRIGTISKTANLAYRAEFLVWALRITGTLNVARCPLHALAYLINASGNDVGVGDWRNEKEGWAGSYHLASLEEEAAWDAFAEGKGPMPVAEQLQQAAE